MKFKFHARQVAVALVFAGAALTGQVSAQVANNQLFNQAGQQIIMRGDPDNTGDGSVFIFSEGVNAASGLLLFDAGGNDNGTLNPANSGKALLYGNDVGLTSNGPITLQSGGTTTINSTTNTLTATTNNLTATTNNLNGTANINASVNSATNINTGTSTGAVTVGNSANTTSLNSATNNIGVNAYATTNNMGTGTAASTNSIGNTQTGTTVTATAGNASQSLANNSANTRVSGGTSGLTARTGVANVATSAQVLLQNSGGTTVDANGKILVNGATGYVAPTAPTAALTLTNGYGNTHGVVVTESQTTVSGGTQSSSLTLTDTNARFSRASNGAPITVTGVADGRNDFDAVNVRQFAGAVAAVSAQANIPGLQQGQDRSIGLGVGNFMGKTALAMGLNYRADNAGIYRLSLSTGTQAGAKPVVGAGAAWSF